MVVDSSALIAILLNESERHRFNRIIEAGPALILRFFSPGAAVSAMIQCARLSATHNEPSSIVTSRLYRLAARFLDFVHDRDTCLQLAAQTFLEGRRLVSLAEFLQWPGGTVFSFCFRVGVRRCQYAKAGGPPPLRNGFLATTETHRFDLDSGLRAPSAGLFL